MAVKVGKSFFTPRLCLVWETEKPLVDRHHESPEFRFMNQEWCLKLVYDSRSPPSYDVYIVKRSGEGAFRAFSVTVHFENSRKGGEVLFHGKRYVSSPGDILYRVNRSDLISKVADLDVNGDFTLVFVFQGTGDGEPHQLNDQKAIQDVPDEDGASSLSLDLPSSLDSLSEDFANMLQKAVFPDVQLKSGDRVIPAHKAVLAARSEVFAAMFSHDMSESSSGIVNIEDIDTPAVDAFLRYLYSGKISEKNLTEDLVIKLYAASDKYAVYALRKICSLYMTGNMNNDNFIMFLCLADSHSDQDFKNAIICAITKDDSWLKSATWLRFASENAMLANEVFCKYFNK